MDHMACIHHHGLYVEQCIHDDRNVGEIYEKCEGNVYELSGDYMRNVGNI